MGENNQPKAIQQGSLEEKESEPASPRSQSDTLYHMAVQLTRLEKWDCHFAKDMLIIALKTSFSITLIILDILFEHVKNEQEYNPETIIV